MKSILILDDDQVKSIRSLLEANNKKDEYQYEVLEKMNDINSLTTTIDIIEQHDELKVFLEFFIDTMLSIKEGKQKTMLGFIDDISESDDCINVETIESSRCSCCSDEHHFYTVPKRFLASDNWMDMYKEELRLEEQENQRRLEERRILAEKEKQVKEEERKIKELELLKELKAKYEKEK